ncbi:HIT domain-containing protein [Caballeronia jiangsuensis]|uniref:HIT domain-containing protein n=1 Tax=Caballeronia jiangsuensis TaxID=1458357 RepID=A0ABW9CX79_9BURK
MLDGYPVSPAHSLVIPKRHVASFFEVTRDERACLFPLPDDARAASNSSYGPDGFNISINDGAAAGQAVPHLHIHLMPRHVGDVADPRGRIWRVIPTKKDYRSQRD